MIKEWYIIENGNKIGPFSIADLGKLPGFNANTLVWREGMATPLRAFQVPELSQLFENSDDTENDNNLKQASPIPSADELVLDYDRGRPPNIYWFVLLLTILVLWLIQLLMSR